MTDHEQRARRFFNDASAALRAGEFAVADKLSTSALREFPGDANLLCLGARARFAQRDLGGAKKHLDEAIRLHADFAPAHDALGDVLLADGYVQSAIKAYQQALRLDPTRGVVVRKLEKAETLLANAAPRQEAELQPTQPAQKMKFADEIAAAEQHVKAGAPQKAETIYRNILKRDPDHVEAARLLAGVAVEHKRHRDAEVMLRHALQKAPDYGRLWVDLTNVLRELEKLDAALECAQEVVRLTPDRAEPYMLLASVLGARGEHDEAIAAYERALAIDPDRAGAVCAMAHHLKTIGRQDDAIAAYRHSIELRADYAEAYWSLANLKTFRFRDDEVQAMQALLDNDDTSDTVRLQLHNALGLEFESSGQYDPAFQHFERCNQLRRKAEYYDPVDTESHCDRTIDVFDQALIERHGDAGCADPAPILIVGLPRSGSTLIEQILASHSQVDGTHELGDLARVVQRTCRKVGRNAKFPDAVADLPAEALQKAGDAYIASTAKFRGSAAFFVDKNPNNFAYVGFLRLILPNAKVINARRHPLDSCFGSWKQLFASGQPFTYDLVELGEYYVQYQRLMDHWHALLPNYVLDVHYERVVSDLETEVRRLLDFCGLPFEDQCLRYYETERAVKTASSEQVRQPIYSSSVNLWRRYEAHLGDLIDVLQPLLSELPAADRPTSL